MMKHTVVVSTALAILCISRRCLAGDHEPREREFRKGNLHGEAFLPSFGDQFLDDFQAMGMHPDYTGTNGLQVKGQGQISYPYTEDDDADNYHQYSLINQFYKPIDQPSCQSSLESAAHQMFPSSSSLAPSLFHGEDEQPDMNFDELYDILHGTEYEENPGFYTCTPSEMLLLDSPSKSTSQEEIITARTLQKDPCKGGPGRGKGKLAEWKVPLRGRLMKMYRSYIKEFPQTLQNAIKHLDHVADPKLTRLLLHPDPNRRRDAAERIHAQCGGIGTALISKPNKKPTATSKAKAILKDKLYDVVMAIRIKTGKEYDVAYRYVSRAYKHMEELSSLQYNPSTHDRIIELILYDAHHNINKVGRPRQPVNNLEKGVE